MTWGPETESWKDEAGEDLPKEAAESWEAYKKRLKTRHKLGKSADKLVRMVDRFLPKVAAETRVFIMRFPHEIPDLLKQARKIRRRAKARHQRGEASASRASASATPDNMEKLGGERDDTEYEHEHVAAQS